jgi:hypothetical protein
VTLSEFHPDLFESGQTNATVKLRRRIDRVMVKRRRFVGHSVDASGTTRLARKMAVLRRTNKLRPLREGRKQ